MARVVPTRAITSFNMSPVDLSISVMLVILTMAVFVRSWVCRTFRSEAIGIMFWDRLAIR